MDRDQKPKEGVESGKNKLISGLDESFFMKEDKGMIEDLLDGTGRKEDIIIDGRIFREGETVFDLEDVVEEGPSQTSPEASVPVGLDEELVEEIRAVAERVARELIPDIAERIIREEIEKLKREES
jgi:hypothetical protein